MSATLRVEDFVENTTLFPIPPPLISISARQHPVTVHFNRRTSPDYVNEAIKKAVKIHARLPPGGILIFMTGQNEISGVCRKLEARFGKKALEARRNKAREREKAKTVRKEDDSTKVEGESSDPTIRVAPRLGKSFIGRFLRISLTLLTADVELEEVDLGVDTTEINENLDGDPSARDDEALDSEEDSENDELYIDMDDSDGSFASYLSSSARVMC